VVLIGIGVSSLGWIGYQYFGTNVPAQAAARAEVSALESEWNNGTGPDLPSSSPASPTSASAPSTTAARYTQAQLDQAMAILTIPVFGPDYKEPILVGTSEDILGRGVGWYDTTQLPGQIGNFAIAGHRITHGEPFARLLELKVGDQVIVETKRFVYTYVIDSPATSLTVPDTDTSALDPVPQTPGVTPTQARITLTTCRDLFHSPTRSIAFGHLTSTSPRN
jgi:sortase A